MRPAFSAEFRLGGRLEQKLDVPFQMLELSAAAAALPFAFARM